MDIGIPYEQGSRPTGARLYIAPDSRWVGSPGTHLNPEGWLVFDEHVNLFQSRRPVFRRCIFAAGITMHRAAWEVTFELCSFPRGVLMEGENNNTKFDRCDFKSLIAVYETYNTDGLGQCNIALKDCKMRDAPLVLWGWTGHSPIRDIVIEGCQMEGFESVPAITLRGEWENVVIEQGYNYGVRGASEHPAILIEYHGGPLTLREPDAGHLFKGDDAFIRAPRSMKPKPWTREHNKLIKGLGTVRHEGPGKVVSWV